MIVLRSLKALTIGTAVVFGSTAHADTVTLDQLNARLQSCKEAEPKTEYCKGMIMGERVALAAAKTKQNPSGLYGGQFLSTPSLSSQCTELSCFVTLGDDPTSTARQGVSAARLQGNSRANDRFGNGNQVTFPNVFTAPQVAN